MYKYTVTFLPYEGRQFNNPQQLARALRILADRLEEKREINVYQDIISGEHGRLLKDVDIPPCHWTIGVNNGN